MTNEQLMELAVTTRQKAYVPISHFKVGAAVLCESGNIYTGCNIEDITGIGVTNICGERNAFLKLIEKRDFKPVKIAIAGGKNELIKCMPCGVCRQYMYPFNKNLIIIVEENQKLLEYKLSDLLKDGFYIEIGEKDES
ncbi:MAG: cytidine deaminase [Bacilli bacterium]